MATVKKINLSDIIKRIIISGIVWVFIGYVAYLYFIGGYQLVQDYYLPSHLFYVGELIFIGVFMIIFFGIYPVYFKYIRVWFCLLWLALILLGDTIFINSATNHIYIADIIKIFGVILTFLAWTDLLYTKKSVSFHKESKVEIIEV